MKIKKSLMLIFTVIMVAIASISFDKVYAAFTLSMENYKIGWRFRYGDYGVQNFVAVTHFTLSQGADSREVFCLQPGIVTIEGNTYNDPLERSVVLGAMAPVSPMAGYSPDNTPQRFWDTELSDTVKKSLNIAYMWYKTYHKDSLEARSALQWFIWNQSNGYAHYFIDLRRTVDLSSAMLTNSQNMAKLNDGYKYLDRAGIDAGRYVPHGDGISPSYMWDLTFLDKTFALYDELCAYYENFNANEMPSFATTNYKLYPGDVITIPDTKNVLSKAEYTVKAVGAPAGISVSKSGNSIKIEVASNFSGSWNGNVTVTRFENNNIGKSRIYGTNGYHQLLFEGGLPITQTLVGIEVSSGRITLTKVDSITKGKAIGDCSLDGAVYNVYNSSNQLVDTITTNIEGKATTKYLPLGNYVIRESKASLGYTLSTDDIHVTIASTSEATLYPIAIGYEESIDSSIGIFKVLSATDYDPEIGLAGAQFKITLNSDSTQVYYTTVSGDDGLCKLDSLPYGTYTAEESTVPASALKVDNFTISVVKDDEELEFKKTDVSKVMTMKIRKIDYDKKALDPTDYTQGDAVLKGAEYTIYRDAALTQVLDVITVDKQDDEGYWYAKSKEVRVGEYWVKETKASPGYNLDPEVYYFNQPAADQTIRLTEHTQTSKEKVIRGKIKVIKYDNGLGLTDESPAEGAILRLTLDSKPSKYYDLVIDE